MSEMKERRSLRQIEYPYPINPPGFCFFFCGFVSMNARAADRVVAAAAALKIRRVLLVSLSSLSFACVHLNSPLYIQIKQNMGKENPLQGW